MNNIVLNRGLFANKVMEFTFTIPCLAISFEYCKINVKGNFTRWYNFHIIKYSPKKYEVGVFIDCNHMQVCTNIGNEFSKEIPDYAAIRIRQVY